jgi:hypothetical protein
MACVLAAQITCYVVYLAHPAMYFYWYWVTEFVCLLVGYGIIIEIMEKCLAPYEGARKFAQSAGLILLGLVILFALILSLTKPAWSAIDTAADLERELRIVEALVLAMFMGVMFHYGIAIGKNMKGIIIGYGLFITTVIIGLAVLPLVGETAYAAYAVVQSCSYLTSLLFWTVALWSYHPNPVPEHSKELEADYEAVALKTRTALGTMLSYLAKAART